MSKRLEASDDRLVEIVERLKTGSLLMNEAKALGYSQNALRRALRKFLGGVVQYEALMKVGNERRKVHHWKDVK
jgi:hypothetical protein